MPRSRRSSALIGGAVAALFVVAASTGYTVERGDTLGRIAREHDVSVSELAEVNDLDNPDLIFPGQVLTIPGGDAEPVLHVVERGETLRRIADRYDTSITSLVDANGLVSPDLILVGQRLSIPSSENPAADAPESDDRKAAGSLPEETYVRSGDFHVVRRGETVESIASDHSGVTVEDLIDANGIVDRTIYAGTRLFLDGARVVAGGTGTTVNHVVVRGDRLGDLAARYGTSVSAIVAANNLADPNLIRTGRALTIPSTGSWVCPLSGASFFNDWGFPRSGGRYHEGNDMFSAFASPVKAPVSGRLEYKVGSIGGYQFNLYGDDGIEYLGSHMSGFAGSERRVEPGETIGYVGTSGNAAGTRPHTHFGMYLNEIAVNPYPTLVENGCK